MNLETSADMNQNVTQSIKDLASDLTKVSLLEDTDDNNLTSAELEKQLEIENLFRSNLSQQLIDEYRRYAIEQHPNDPHKRKELIEQMQEDYYRYYLENVQQSLLYHQREQLTFLEHMKSCGDAFKDMEIRIMPLIPARMWVRPDIATFKKEILSTSKECCIKIGSLATATVSVPTHKDGTNVWWEFATDNYDLGFGLFFEWNAEPSDQILVTVNESDDELDEDEDEEAADEEDSQEEDVDRSTSTNETGNLIRNQQDPEVAYNPSRKTKDDPEVGRRRRGRRSSGGLPNDELIPIVRHDCHQQVYCGQHQYPGQGRYLFKFDNSFSILRSKWLYYRIYYSKE